MNLLLIDTQNTLQPIITIFSAVCIILLLVVIFLVLRVEKLKNYTLKTVKYQKKLEQENKSLNEKYKNLTVQSEELKEGVKILRDSRDKMEQLAYTDYLTGFPNRIAFTEMLESVTASFKKGESIAILDIDIDNFKNVNDRLGHSSGDQMIIDVAHRLLKLKGPADYLAKIGEDEFAFLIKDPDKVNNMLEFIDNVRACFIPAFILYSMEVFATGSIGVAYAPKDGKNAQTIMRNASIAMYHAKDIGKNTFVIYDEELYRASTKKVELQSELRQAMENKQFVLYYQPQLDLEDGSVNGFEALLRWNHPMHGIIPPGDFIPLAEDTGLIVPMGNMILKEACIQLKEWENMGYGEARIAINISGRQFRDSNFVNEVKNIIEYTKVNAGQIEFEVTESIVLENLQAAIEIMTNIKKLGITFVLDDFGTGYSSLNYLKKIPVNKLKIDKSFISSVLESDNDQYIAEVMISLAQNLELVVIAEGVEKKEQELFLKKINCDTVQGYLYSRPVNAEEAGRLLEETAKKKFAGKNS